MGLNAPALQTMNGIARASDVLPTSLHGLASQRYPIDDRVLELRVLTETVDWALLEPCWDDWVAATPGATVFQSYRFLRIWWDHYGQGQQLQILLICDQEKRLIGIAPLMISVEKKKKGQVCNLGFICSRSDANRPVFLFGEHHAICLPATLYYLKRHRQTWEKAYFYEQPLDERTDTLVARLVDLGYLVVRMRDFECPYLVLEHGWETFIGSYSRKFRKNIEAGLRKLKSHGNLEYRTYTSPDDAEKLIDIHVCLERKGWKSGKKVGIAVKPQFLAFYQDMARRMAAAGHFVGRAYLVNGEAVASTFGLEYLGVFYSLHIAHDAAYSQSSPGTCLEARELEDCFQRHLREYDFLGGFKNNKKRWTDTERQTDVVIVYPPTVYYRVMILWVTKVQPRLRHYQKILLRRWDKEWKPALQAWVARIDRIKN